jgi:hypothetical protein
MKRFMQVRRGCPCRGIARQTKVGTHVETNVETTTGSQAMIDAGGCRLRGTGQSL